FPSLVGLGVGLGGFMAPGNLDEIDSGCWDSSSLAGIQTRRLRLADSRGALWDFMTYLRASQRQKHNELFLELAQHFWAMYVDCMLSRAHGLGKRVIYWATNVWQSFGIPIGGFIPVDYSHIGKSRKPLKVLWLESSSYTAQPLGRRIWTVSPFCRCRVTPLHTYSFPAL
uniref:Family with sequence similarity 237 member B n=1 Tax=Salmo trutta TaxID=8032 RepID=A0A674BE11_SALTR